MDYKPNVYSNRDANKPSFRYKTNKCIYLNSSFNSDFVLINGKIYEISFDVSPFQIYNTTKLKTISYTRDHHQAKPLQIKLKDLVFDTRSSYNNDKEGNPTIFCCHSGVDSFLNNNYYSITLLPQQIQRFNLRVNDNFNEIDFNYYFSSLTNGTLENVINSSDKYIIFKSSGSFVLDKRLTCDILVIGGGGGGGGDIGGGGGAGGVVYQKAQYLNSGTYTITVGDGGIGSVGNLTNNSVNGNNGNDSKIILSGVDLYVGKGGGGGGNYNGNFAVNGNSGGSGGGGSENNNNTVSNGGSSTQGNTILNNIAGGYAGANGVGVVGGTYAGGGGGGAGGTGINQNGGLGIQINITGENKFYAGGGGAGCINNNYPLGLGGSGIGGDGNYADATTRTQSAKHNGTVNTGSGGGGGAYHYSGTVIYNNGGDGGSGVVILRFKSGLRIEGLTPEETLITTTNSSISITQPSQYQINYENPIKIDKGTYSATFNNGGITLVNSPDYTYPILKDNPIVWYKFDKDFLIDNSGNNKTLTNNGATFDSDIYKKGDGSINFDGSLTKYASLPFIPFHTYINNQGITFSLWISLANTNASAYRRIFGFFANGTNNNNNYISIINHIGTRDYYFELNNGITYGSTSRIITVNLNTFYHVVWSISNTGVWTIYLNGSQIYSQTKITSATYLSTSVSNYFSRGADVDPANFAGNIDDFRIYDRVISPLEVSELYYGNANRSYPLLKDGNNETINPLVWYKFDNSSDLGKDEMNNHNLTNNGGTAYNSTDYTKGIGSASFDGSNDYLSKADAVNLNSKDFSISYWFKRTQNGREDFILNIGSVATTRQIVLSGIISTNKYMFSFGNDDLVSTNTYTDAGIWVHIVNTYKTGTRIRKIYRNGIEIASGTAGGETNTDTLLYIGRHINLYFNGLMDDFRIYEIELTATQVSELYTGRLQIFNPPSFMLGMELKDENLINNNINDIYK